MDTWDSMVYSTIRIVRGVNMLILLSPHSFTFRLGTHLDNMSSCMVSVAFFGERGIGVTG